jgi:release factor glutamine methyltransferase
MRLLTMPGVHHPVSDTWMLRDAMLEETVQGAAVADLCAGSGALAIAAAQKGAHRVVAVDISRRSNLASTINARLNGCAVDVRHGDLIEALDDDDFDVLVSNPPYVPAASDELPRHRSTTPLDAGRDGRALLDRICREAPARLNESGVLLVVHSSVCGLERTCELMEQQGLQTSVVRRERGALGPVMRSRASMLRDRGLLGPRGEEELVVIRGCRSAD